MGRPTWGRRTLRHALLVLGVTGLFLVRPLPANLRGRPVQHVEIAPGVGFLFSLDSYEFIRTATEPRRLLQPRHPRQSRPAYILLAAGLGRVLESLYEWVGKPPPSAPAMVRNPYYASLLVLNFLVMLAALEVFDRLLPAPWTWRLGATMLATFLLANEVVKTYFWMTHSQLFNVLGPLALVAACRYGFRRPGTSAAAALGLGLLGGLASLAYGNFLLFPVGLAVGMLVAGVREGRVGPALRSVAVVAAGFLAPLAGWWAFVMLRVGSFYSDEVVRYRQFVWVVDALRQGPGALLARFSRHLALTLASARTAVVYAIVLLVAIAAAARATGVRPATLDRETRTTLASAGVAFALLATFLVFLGYPHDTRFVWNLVPPLLVAGGALLGAAHARAGRPTRRALDAGIAAVALGWLAYEFWRPYPF